MNQINDPGISPEERLAALRVVAGQESFPDWVVESNNHIHTCYSFSPYTPSGAALGARRAGLRVVGSVDHDSIAAAAEMTEATRILGRGSSVAPSSIPAAPSPPRNSTTPTPRGSPT